jgi:hypothetical protein
MLRALALGYERENVRHVLLCSMVATGGIPCWPRNYLWLFWTLIWVASRFLLILPRLY